MARNRVIENIFASFNQIVRMVKMSFDVVLPSGDALCSHMGGKLLRKSRCGFGYWCYIEASGLCQSKPPLVVVISGRVSPKVTTILLGN